MARWITLSSMPQKRGPVMLALYEGVSEIGEIATKTGLTFTTVTGTIKELNDRLGVVEDVGAGVTGGAGRPAVRYCISATLFEEHS